MGGSVSYVPGKTFPKDFSCHPSLSLVSDESMKVICKGISGILRLVVKGRRPPLWLKREVHIKVSKCLALRGVRISD